MDSSTNNSDTPIPEDQQPKQSDEFSSHMRAVGLVAMMGELFGNTKKEVNDWKARMLKAGLANRGLSMPEDWDTLTEDEKEKRLNGVIAFLNENK